MTPDADGNWERFHLDRVRANYPRWPNEAMVKIVFGSYLRRRVTPGPGARILDVGCGFGNNLLPFLEKGMECHGVEVTAEIARLAQQLLDGRGLRARVVEGRNTRLPFEDGYFDLLLSLNVIHYEKDEAGIRAALGEYRRVLKQGGTLLLMTVGPEHTIQKRAIPLAPHRYRIADYDFRNGEEYFYFDDLGTVDRYLGEFYEGIELGRVTERLFTMDLDFLVGVCRKGGGS